MSRKVIRDDVGVLIAESLSRNKYLEHIDLSGNKLKHKSAHEFGLTLRKNRALKHLSLELNDLTDNGTNTLGIKEMAEALRTNSTLI